MALDRRQRATRELMDLKPVYLICGSDWPKVDAAMARLRARFPEESIEQLSIGDEGVDVVAACNALDLLGGPRLVLVRGVEALAEDGGRSHCRLPELAHPRDVPGAFWRRRVSIPRVRWCEPSMRPANRASSTLPIASKPPTGW